MRDLDLLPAPDVALGNKKHAVPTAGRAPLAKGGVPLSEQILPPDGLKASQTFLLLVVSPLNPSGSVCSRPSSLCSVCGGRATDEASVMTVFNQAADQGSSALLGRRILGRGCPPLSAGGVGA